MRTYMDCLKEIMNISLKLIETDDTFQITMGNELFDVMEDLDDVIESQFEEIEQTSNVSSDEL